MQDGKSWLQSKTIWGVIVSAIGVVAMVVHFDAQATVTDIESLASVITTGIGLVLSIIGRFKATKTIG